MHRYLIKYMPLIDLVLRPTAFITPISLKSSFSVNLIVNESMVNAMRMRQTLTIRRSAAVSMSSINVNLTVSASAEKREFFTPAISFLSAFMSSVFMLVRLDVVGAYERFVILVAHKHSGVSKKRGSE